MENFWNKIKQIPLGVSGLSLGLMGYFSLIDNIFNYNKVYNGWYFSIFSLVISLCLITLLIIKTFKHKETLKKELCCPLSASIWPTFSMVLMTWSGFIAGWSQTAMWSQIIAIIIMIVAVILHLVLIVNFVVRILMKHSWNKNVIFGSWFVPLVGICTSATFTTRFNNQWLPHLFFQIIWFFGFALFILTFFIFTYSIMFKTKPEHEQRLSIAIYFAPINLTLASFCKTFLSGNGHYYNQKALFVIFIILFMFSFVFSIYLLFFVVNFLFKNKFSYLYAALTFPLAITATSLLYSAQVFGSFFMLNNELGYLLHEIFLYWSYIYTAIAGINIIYIFVRYCINITKIFIKNQNNNLYLKNE